MKNKNIIASMMMNAMNNFKLKDSALKCNHTLMVEHVETIT